MEDTLVNIEDVVKRDIYSVSDTYLFQINPTINKSSIRLTVIKTNIYKNPIYDSCLDEYNKSFVLYTYLNTQNEILSVVPVFKLIGYDIHNSMDNTFEYINLVFIPNKKITEINCFQEIEGHFEIHKIYKNNELKIIKKIDNYLGNDNSIYLLSELIIYED